MMVETESLRSIALFRGLNQQELEMIAEEVTQWECAKGQYIFKEGDESTVLYAVTKGEVVATISAGIFLKHKIATISEGECFGELAFIDQKPRTASVKATKRSQVITLSRDDFLKIGKTNQHIQTVIYKNIGRILAKRLRAANDTMLELAMSDKKLAGYLPQQFMI